MALRYIPFVIIIGVCLFCLVQMINKKGKKKAKDFSAQLACYGVAAMIAAQVVINVGMCTSVTPVIGITLPFFSAGGTSLFCLFLGIGLVLNVYMHRNSRTIYLRD